MAKHCPVCGFSLDAPAWIGDRASFEICSCCGTQFGYVDACGGDLAARRAWWRLTRREWVEGGKLWRGFDNPPVGWDASAQLERVAGTLPDGA